MILKHFLIVLILLIKLFPFAKAQTINQVNPQSVGMNYVFPSYRDTSCDWNYSLRIQNLFGLSELSSAYGSLKIQKEHAFFTFHTGIDQSSLERPFRFLISGNNKVKDELTLGSSIELNPGNHGVKPKLQLGFSSNYARTKKLSIGQHFSLNLVKGEDFEPASVLRFYVQWQSQEQLSYFIAAQIQSRGWMGIGSLTLNTENKSWTIGLLVDQNPQAYFGTQWKLGYGKFITALYYHKQLHFTPQGEYSWLAN